MAGYTGPAVGIEWDMPACRTAMAAGHQRVCADVAAYPLEMLAGRTAGLICSPPCTSFSGAGSGAGRLVTAVLINALTRTSRGEKVLSVTRRECARILKAHTLRKMGKLTRAQRSAWAWRQAATTVLVAQPLRWAVALRPRWIALEQVPAVLPLWQQTAMLLREHGYQVWCGILSAERYGVPQTRKRAILIASLDGPAGPPEPTHQAYRSGTEAVIGDDLFGSALPPPVSMAQALGWGLPDRPAWTVCGGGTDTGGAETFSNAKCRAQLRRVSLRNNTQNNASTRGADEPAGTIFFGQRGNAADWVLRGGVQSNSTERSADQPAPAVCFGNDAKSAAWMNGGTEAARITVQEAGMLQSFSAEYPWQGTKTQRYRQAGDAVPPLLAAAILKPLLADSGWYAA